MAAAFFPMPRAGVIDQDAAHGLSREREEMGPVLEGNRIAGGEAQPTFVEQGVGVQGVSRAFVPEKTRSDSLELRVEGADDAITSSGVAASPGTEPICNFRGRWRGGIHDL